MPPSLQILVVEDEPIIAMDLRHRLIHLNYGVVGITDSAEAAISLVEETRPDLILMDICLNGVMAGIDIADQIRSIYNVPVIFLTAHGDLGTFEQAKAVSPFGYVIKPFSNKDLITTIEIAISKYQAETAIQKALERERELNQLKSQFIGLVSHEFRTPLSIISITLDMLENYPAQLTETKRRTYLHQARSALEHLREMLEDVLIMNESTTREISCYPVAINLEEFCQKIIDETKAVSLQNHSIQLISSPSTLSPEDIPVLLDPKLTKHIVTNLLLNALKYSPPSSSVEVELSHSEAEVRIVVKDTGIGIPPADQANLFKLFYRASNVGMIQGTGLGLAIVKQCIDAHNGNISFESQLGKGTTFTVRLPNCQPATIETTIPWAS
ncbi:ATP-binding protein [Alkalinema pantanalense CENA528]|uniref:hybrid sensor histidine kinase/response regulator n=1 Tax=Alkalinema pantanalense TaxID=1620705 RepID=UPI003D6E3177